MWPSFCPHCRDERKPSRDQERALKRRIHALGRKATIYDTTGAPLETTVAVPRKP